MCDYCGCRSEPEIAALSADHERMLTLTAALRRAHESGAPAPELIAELTGLLGPHARREERGVFAALVAEGIDAAYVLRFEHDHDTIEELLADADARHQIAPIVDLLEDHILREESDLFPAAYQLLGSDAWETIAASISTDESPDGAAAAPQMGERCDPDEPQE
ncbi:MAG TPA: hemerythrin domain-containing protein [Ilumatobacteraceae bacterium]|nr:hemerythrin domain-containing protein [Ilumatobacteraceae bacterium]